MHVSLDDARLSSPQIPYYQDLVQVLLLTCYRLNNLSQFFKLHNFLTHHDYFTLLDKL